DATGDVLHVAADELAEHGDLVDERDLRRQEAVRGVLDQLRRLDVGDDEGNLQRVQRRVDLLHQLDRFRIRGADDDAVGTHEVLDRRAFAEELRVRHDGSGMAGGGLGDDALYRPPRAGTRRR